MGVDLLRHHDDVIAYLERNTKLGGDDDAFLLAEKYTEHDLFHVDGLILDGEPVLVWPSECSSTLSYRDGIAYTSALLDPDDPLTPQMQELTLRTVEALSFSQTMTFHAEIFRTPDGRLIMNEIGCRIGGAKIYETIQLAFGIDLAREYVHAVGSPAAAPPRVTAPRVAAGHATFPGRPGTLVSAPQECAIPGVDQYRLNVPEGTVLDVAEHSSSRIASVVVKGADRAEVLDTLDRAVRWFDETAVIAPRGDPA
jgi:biotin carboxylase